MGMVLNVQITDPDLCRRLTDEQAARGHRTVARTAQTLLLERLHQIELARTALSTTDDARSRAD